MRAKGFFGRMAASYMEFQRGAAFRASQGLGVEAAVEGGFVFGAAIIAKRESGHRGVGPVVRHCGDDGVARAALGAIDEGVSVASFIGIGELLNAVITGEQVRWYVNFGLAGTNTWQDLECRGGFRNSLL